MVEEECEGLRRVAGIPIPVLMDGAYLLYDNSIERQVTNFETAISGGPFSVSSTGLTYPQINWLTQDGLLGASEKAGGRGWRKFEFREIVYLRVLSELRSFGVGNDALRGLHDLFYRNPSTADQIILACLKASEPTMLYYADGTGFVVSPERLFEAEKRDDEAVKLSAIRVSMSRAVREALELIGLETMETLDTFGNRIRKLSLAPQEQAVVDALRNDDFTEIEVRKKNGEPVVMHVASNVRLDVPNDVLMPLLMRDFADISIVRRDGKTVCVNINDTIKL